MAGKDEGKSFYIFRLRNSLHKLSPWRLCCNSSLSCLPFYLSLRLLDLCSWEGDIFFLTGSSTSSVPFGGISGYYPLRSGLGGEPAVRDAWCLLLGSLLEADPVRCALGTSAGWHCLLGPWRDPGYKAPKRDLSLAAAAFKPAFASQDCSAGWCYKECEQYGKAKEQNIVLISVFLETWSMVLGTICCICWCCAHPGSSKKASVCWSPSST